MTADDQVRAARDIADDAAADVLAGLAVGRVAAVLAEHRMRTVWDQCTCGWRPDGRSTPLSAWEAHVATAIVAALSPP